MFGMIEALLSFFLRQVGLRTDAASATGSAHAKLAHIVANTGIKSIQRGTIALGVADKTKAATISAVNTNKAMVNPLGVRAGDTYASYYVYDTYRYTAAISHMKVTLTLTNGTTVTATRDDHNDTVATVSYEVIEFV